MADTPPPVDHRFDAPTQMVPVTAERTFQYVVTGIISLLTLLGTLIYYSITERLRTVELYGTPAIREKVATLEADNRSIQRDLVDLRADVRTILEILRMTTRDQQLKSQQGSSK